MLEQSSMHPYLNWAKERLGEMDAALASLEAKAAQMTDDSKLDADQLMADLKKQRGEFQAAIKEQVEAGEVVWQRTKPQLESQWDTFEAQVKTYIDTVAKQIPQQQAIFGEVATAQMKAWREAADTIRETAMKFAARATADIDAAVKQMKGEASEAETRLQKLKQTGTESWAVLSAGLAESRKAFDRANQAACDAVKRIASP